MATTQTLAADTDVNVVSSQASGDALASITDFQKSRGTQASPSSVNSGDALGTVRFKGHDGTAFIEGASLGAVVSASPGTNDMPADLVLKTTSDGASSATERLRVTSAGRVGIGTSSPGGKLTVYGDSERLLLDAPSAGGQTGIVMQGNGGALFKSEILYDTGNLAFRTTQNGTLSTGLYVSGVNGRVGIGTSAPNAFAALDVTSVIGAVLLPRMTTTERNALTATNGMLIYNTTANKFQGYENGAWVNLV